MVTPPPPTGFSASDLYCNYVHLAWLGVSSADYYKVYRDGGWITDTVNTSYDDTPGDSDNHSYKVKACNYACGCSGYSSSDYGRAITAPSAPTSASANPNPACTGQTVTLSASGGSGGDLKWYKSGCGSGSSIGTGSPITITAPSSNTTYYVRRENSCGNSSCKSVTLSVTSPPSAPTSASANPNPACTGQTVTLSASGGSGGDLKWYKSGCGSGSSIGTGSPITITAPSSNTTYYVRRENSCGNSTCESVSLSAQECACQEAWECDDGDPCTRDECIDHVCVWTLEGDCSSDADCNDDDPCTDDECVNCMCQHSNNSASCDDGDPCTENDRCSGGVCFGTQKDCDDGILCTIDSCVDGVCINDNSGCICNKDSDCPSQECKSARCVNHNCEYDLIGECATDSDCDDGDPNTNDLCVNCNCEYEQFVGCGDGICQSDETCYTCREDCGKCTDCGNGHCEPELGEDGCNCPEDCEPPECCSDADCDDHDPCTTDSCNNNTCSFAEISGCCEDNDDCEANEICLGNECVQDEDGSDDDGDDGDGGDDGPSVGSLAPPTGVKATNDDTDKVRVTWDGGSNTTEYRVYRCTSTDTESCTAISDWQSETSFDDTTAVPGTTYWYRVKARNEDGQESRFSTSDSGGIPHDSDGGVTRSTPRGSTCGLFGMVSLGFMALGMTVLRVSARRRRGDHDAQKA